MPRFGSLPPEEIERRRALSNAAIDDLKKTEWQRTYQERMDSFYWSKGPCCAGCDHWISEAGDLGQCTAAPIVSGVQVLKSMGIDWCSYIPPPDHPFTRRDHVCGAFKDEFDWSSLDEIYRKRIGAP